MDDIKLYASTQKQLHQLLQITHSYTKDIQMEFGLDKCKTLHIEKGILKKEDFALGNGDIIESMEEGEFYKYLGFQQAKLTEHAQIKQRLIKEYQSRLNAILRTQLNAKHTVKAINTYVIPVLTYSFGVIHWTHTDLEQLQRKTRTTLTKHKQHHPKSATERLTLPRKDGGRGLIDIVNLHYKQIQSLREFFYKKQETSQLHKAVTLADSNNTPLNLHSHHMDTTQHIKSIDTIKQSWARKALHGRHPYDLAHDFVDKTASNSWLARGCLFGETEGFMIAIQDQVINTKNYRKHILKDATLTNDTCRKCHIMPETIQHITSGCKLLAQTDNLHRHNQVANTSRACKETQNI
ncbi:uncharacterized protein [Centruroides vittatus]|uniref:uncharacterized protein n=1 Tax=Centruroides vittatus TaxID=120091 RepID=UPI00350FCAF6